jgi:hypothetical protein
MPIQLADYSNSPSKKNGQVVLMEKNASFQAGGYRQQVQSFTVTAEDDETASLVVTDAKGDAYSFSYTGTESSASLAIQGSVGKITLTAVTAGVAGNLVSIILADTATAGSETISVSSNQITVGIESGVSTAAQIKTAIEGNGGSAALVTVVADTAGAMEAISEDFLEGGEMTSVQIRNGLLALMQADAQFSSSVKSAAASTADIQLTVLSEGEDCVVSSLVGAGSLSEDTASTFGAAVIAGRAVVRSSSDAQAMELPGSGSASADLIGIVVRKQAYSVSANNVVCQVPLGEFGEVMKRGEIYVEVDDTVAAGDDVYIRKANGTLGIARNDSASGDAIQLSASKFLEAGVSGDYVRIEINQP